MDDLYKKLQVDPGAEPEVIRAAHHALARKYHPDIGGDAVRMVEINAAWAVLRNPSLRSAYDVERTQPNTTPATAAHGDPPSYNGPGHSDRPPRSKHDSSTVLDFGRYAGWSLEQLVNSDPEYLKWLARTPIGRRLSAEIKGPLEIRAASVSAAGATYCGPRSAGPIGSRRERAWAGRQWFGRVMQDS
jgi:curved DNA-binding protein CbpA